MQPWHSCGGFTRSLLTSTPITLETGTPGMSFDAVADYCRELDVPYTRISVPVYQIVFEERQEKNPCSLCAKLRRGALNTALKDWGIQKSPWATTTTTRWRPCS